MSGINEDEINQEQQQQAQTPLYTREDVANILREFERERDEQKELSYKGKQLPEGIREVLDSTPTSDLKEDIKRYKKLIPRYKHEEWTKNQQINKEFVPDLKKWKVDSHQVVTSIFKYAESARLQARASTEIFEILESIEENLQFRSEEDHQTFITAMSQAAKLEVFGFTQGRSMDQDAKEYASKALRLPASLRHVEQEEDSKTTNLFDTEFVKNLHEARFAQKVISGAANNSNGRGRGFPQRGYGRGTRPFSRSNFGNFQQRGRGRGTFTPSTTNQHSTNSYTDNTTNQ